jgi:hypothetical protein
MVNMKTHLDLKGGEKPTPPPITRETPSPPSTGVSRFRLRQQRTSLDRAGKLFLDFVRRDLQIVVTLQIEPPRRPCPKIARET